MVFMDSLFEEVWQFEVEQDARSLCLQQRNPDVQGPWRRLLQKRARRLSSALLPEEQLCWLQEGLRRLSGLLRVRVDRCETHKLDRCAWNMLPLSFGRQEAERLGVAASRSLRLECQGEHSIWLLE